MVSTVVCLLDQTLWAKFSWKGEKAHVSSLLEVLGSQTGIPKGLKRIWKL